VDLSFEWDSKFSAMEPSSQSRSAGRLRSLTGQCDTTILSWDRQNGER
jgi:hypothetical protein